MRGIDPGDLLRLVIRPTLAHIGLGGASAEELLLGTAMQESAGGASLDQNGGGPARGVWQMEPATHDDIWKNFLPARAGLTNRINNLLFTAMPAVTQLTGNLYYACAMARIHYYRSPLPLPLPGDLAGQAQMYKKVYNTHLGAATVEDYIRNARRVLYV